MSKTEKPKGKKDTSKVEQLSLKDYLALKKKKILKSEDNRLPLPIKFFILFPILFLCFILCFGMFCIPRLTVSNNPVSEKQK